MIFAAIFAGGIGSRMGGTEKPKQFLPLGGRPILVHTVERFLQAKQVDVLFVLTPTDWTDYTRDTIRQHLGDVPVAVIAGGETRNDTLLCAIRHVYAHYPVDAQTILLTHDAVRPFVTVKMIDDNIEAVRQCGACDTVIPATDTIVHSADGEMIDDIPQRSALYHGQTPQSFLLDELRRTVESLTPEETQTLTDACKIYTVRGKRVRLVQGAPTNIKITYADDLAIAEAIWRTLQ